MVELPLPGWTTGNCVRFVHLIPGRICPGTSWKMLEASSGWWLSPTPLKNDGVKVSWDDEIPN